jgi:hypothetical protein
MGHTTTYRIDQILPEFAEELKILLLASKEPLLAAQVPDLVVARRCSCEDDFCATFYTKYEPSMRPYRDARCLELEPKEGMIILDVVCGLIAKVEVLYRDDVRRRLRAIFP